MDGQPHEIPKVQEKDFFNWNFHSHHDQEMVIYFLGETLPHQLRYLSDFNNHFLFSQFTFEDTIKSIDVTSQNLASYQTFLL